MQYMCKVKVDRDEEIFVPVYLDTSLMQMLKFAIPLNNIAQLLRLWLLPLLSPPSTVVQVKNNRDEGAVGSSNTISTSA
jgi:hypothetical protein